MIYSFVIDCLMFNIHQQIFHAYSELEQVQQYSKQYTDKREGLDKEDIDF